MAVIRLVEANWTAALADERSGDAEWRRGNGAGEVTVRTVELDMARGVRNGQRDVIAAHCPATEGLASVPAHAVVQTDASTTKDKEHRYGLT